MYVFLRSQEEGYEAERPHTDGPLINGYRRVISEYVVRLDKVEFEGLREHTLSSVHSSWRRSIVDRIKKAIKKAGTHRAATADTEADAEEDGGENGD